RELAHLGLDTTGGPSWKPLPVAFTALFAPLSKLNDGLPAALWVVVARAGGLLALALTFRISARTAGGETHRRVIAGTIATVAVVLTPGWLRYMFHGNEAPLAIGLALWAVAAHLDGRRRWALVLGALVCLARPEIFGFLLLYGGYLWWRSPRSRRLTAAVLAFVPLAWLLPSWVGSGDPLFAGEQARSEPSWSLSLAPVPWRAALEVAQSQTWIVLEAGALVAILLALATTRRTRSALPAPALPGLVAALSGFAVGIVGLYAVMTEAGFSGNVRYVLPALVALALLGGVGAALALDVAAGLGRRAAAGVGRQAAASGAAAGAIAATVLLAIVGAPDLRKHVATAHVEVDEAVERSQLHADLTRAVDELGAHYVTSFGPAAVNRSFQTHLAWELSLPLGDVHGARGRGFVFRAPAEPVAGVVHLYRRARQRTLVSSVGQWRVTARPPNARHIFTWPVVGFNLRAAAATGSRSG
ncbi:MAG TPA: hypothetical protein VI111_06130, partial [Thermoleophilaceae bacterium]